MSSKSIITKIIMVSEDSSYLVLTSDIPHGEANVLVLDSFNIETCSFQDNKFWSMSAFIGAMEVRKNSPNPNRRTYSVVHRTSTHQKIHMGVHLLVKSVIL